MNDTIAPPATETLATSKEMRSALTRCINAVEDLTVDERMRVLASLCALHGSRLVAP